MSKIVNNDDRIKDLKEQINNKLSTFSKIPKDFTTNLVLEFRDKMYNLNVLSKKNLQELLVNLYLYQVAIDKLEINGFTLSGYMVEDWISDINRLIDIKDQDLQIKQLKENYCKLDSLMSETAKTAEFLDNVENLLNG